MQLFIFALYACFAQRTDSLGGNQVKLNYWAGLHLSEYFNVRGYGLSAGVGYGRFRATLAGEHEMTDINASRGIGLALSTRITPLNRRFGAFAGVLGTRWHIRSGGGVMDVKMHQIHICLGLEGAITNRIGWRWQLGAGRAFYRFVDGSPYFEPTATPEFIQLGLWYRFGYTQTEDFIRVGTADRSGFLGRIGVAGGYTLGLNYFGTYRLGPRFGIRFAPLPWLNVGVEGRIGVEEPTPTNWVVEPVRLAIPVRVSPWNTLGFRSYALGRIGITRQLIYSNGAIFLRDYVGVAGGVHGQLRIVPGVCAEGGMNFVQHRNIRQLSSSLNFVEIQMGLLLSPSRASWLQPGPWKWDR